MIAQRPTMRFLSTAAALAAMFASAAIGVRVAHALDAGPQAALLAADLLLSPPCGTRCLDADNTCKKCGQPLSTGRDPLASDALQVLRAAVGQQECRVCVCDVDGSGSVKASDALLTLRLAVGQNASLSCPAGW